MTSEVRISWVMTRDEWNQLRQVILAGGQSSEYASRLNNAGALAEFPPVQFSGPVSTEEALTFRCRLCGAAVGSMCTYFTPGYVRRGGNVVFNEGLETVLCHRIRCSDARKARAS